MEGSHYVYNIDKLLLSMSIGFEMELYAILPKCLVSFIFTVFLTIILFKNKIITMIPKDASKGIFS